MVMSTCYSTFLNKSLQKQQKYYPYVGMSKDAYEESGYRFMVTEVEERCKVFDTIAIPSITTTLKADFLFRNFFLLILKLPQGKYELE